MNNGGMVPPETLADGRKRALSYLAAQIHGDLSAEGNMLGPPFGCEIGHPNVKEISEASAARRVKQPSSSRTFDETFCAMYMATSLGILRQSNAAFFCRIATRVSRSGAAISAIRPDSKRLRRRSSSPGISRGTLS